MLLSCECCEISKNTFFYRTPLMDASIFWGFSTVVFCIIVGFSVLVSYGPVSSIAMIWLPFLSTMLGLALRQKFSSMLVVIAWHTFWIRMLDWRNHRYQHKVVINQWLLWFSSDYILSILLCCAVICINLMPVSYWICLVAFRDSYKVQSCCFLVFSIF